MNNIYKFLKEDLKLLFYFFVFCVIFVFIFSFNSKIGLDEFVIKFLEIKENKSKFIFGVNFLLVLVIFYFLENFLNFYKNLFKKMALRSE